MVGVGISCSKSSPCLLWRIVPAVYITTLYITPHPLTHHPLTHLYITPPLILLVGTGGNNHAVEYYEAHRFPLAVKLGTITPDGADVYSYSEDDMVLDPKLNQHLAHFGIDVSSMTKVC